MKIYLSILICLLYACPKNHPPTSKNILSKQQFQNILTDIHLAEADLHSRPAKDSTNRQKTTHINIYQKHKTTEKEFNYMLNYYCENPKELEQIYANILEELKKSKAKLNLE
tara:strand:+ start:71 stop:406 length:336 start_codon:yes stop_codon:yes gene_type:complete